MKRLSDQTLYEIIEVSVEAAPEEIARACDRAAATYGPGSLVTYTLASTEEAALLSSRIEEARAVLLDTSARSRYDERLRVRPPSTPLPAAPKVAAPQLAVATPAPEARPESSSPPPPWPPPLPTPEPEPEQRPATMDSRQISPGLPVVAPPAPLLESPAVAILVEARTPPVEPAPSVEHPPPAIPAAPADAATPASPSAEASAPIPAAAPALVPLTEPPISLTRAVAPILLDREVVPLLPLLVPEGAAWSGEMLRRVREARGLTLQQVAERTRISRHQIENIEQDRFKALPATVYLRGIIMSLARELRLDGQKVARSYLDRPGVVSEGEPKR